MLAEAFTVTLMVSRLVSALLSLAFNSNLYTPGTSPVTDVIGDDAFTILYDVGPEIFFHKYPIVPYELTIEPLSVVLFVGSIRVVSLPALTFILGELVFEYS